MKLAQFGDRVWSTLLASSETGGQSDVFLEFGMNTQLGAAPPRDGHRGLVALSAPEPEPDFIVTSHGKVPGTEVVLGFRQVAEMDGSREIKGGVTVELNSAWNSRTFEVLQSIRQILEVAGVKVDNRPPQFFSVPEPNITCLFLEPNYKFYDSTKLLDVCRRLFVDRSRIEEPLVSIPIRPDVHLEPTIGMGFNPRPSSQPRYDLETGKAYLPESSRAASANVLSLKVVGEVIGALKVDLEFQGKGWSHLIWGQVQMSAYRALKEVERQGVSAAASVGSFLNELDTISSVPSMTLPQRNLMTVAYAELANRVERAR